MLGRGAPGKPAVRPRRGVHSGDSAVRGNRFSRTRVPTFSSFPKTWYATTLPGCVTSIRGVSERLGCVHDGFRLAEDLHMVEATQLFHRAIKRRRALNAIKSREDCPVWGRHGIGPHARLVRRVENLQVFVPHDKEPNTWHVALEHVQASASGRNLQPANTSHR
jgi:hypothetical protein